MPSLQHKFVSYTGITDSIPHSLERFLNLSNSFVMAIPNKTWSIYTLHNVTITLGTPCIQKDYLLTLSIKFIYQYTVKDLYHTLHTTSYPYVMTSTLPALCPLSLSDIYVENLFAYGLDNHHIYTSFSLLLIF